MNIYVGNLPYDVTGADLQAAFEAVAAARIITDQASGQSKGFVEMPSRLKRRRRSPASTAQRSWGGPCT